MLFWNAYICDAFFSWGEWIEGFGFWIFVEILSKGKAVLTPAANVLLIELCIFIWRAGR